MSWSLSFFLRLFAYWVIKVYMFFFFLSSAVFFRNQLFRKINNLSNTSRVGTVWIQIRLDEIDGWLRIGLLPPPLGNFADISYLVEN